MADIIAQIRYQLILLFRTPRAIITGLVLPGGLFALELGRTQHLGSSPAAMAALAPRLAGLLVFGAAAIAYFTHANGLVIAREDGVLRRWRASPLPAWAYFAGRVTASVLAADAAGAVLTGVGVTMAGLRLPGDAAAWLLVAQTLGALALAAAGTAVTTVIPTAQAAQPALMLTYIPLLILSGAFGPATELPRWLTVAMTWLPAQPVADAATRALRYGALMSPRDLAVLAGWTVGGLLVSVRFFGWDPHRPQHARRAAQVATSRSESDRVPSARRG